jgi:hypothetical protein
VGAIFGSPRWARPLTRTIAPKSPSVAANPTTGEYLAVWDADDLVNDEFEIYGRRLGVPPPTLVTTEPPSPANDNNPRVRGNVAAGSTIDLFRNSSCLGFPAVDDAPGADLNGAGITVPVADNAITEFSATISSDGHTSRCSNSISYSEQTPPNAAGGGGRGAGGGTPAFGPRTLVS